MKHSPEDEWTGGYTAEEVIEDVLFHADRYVGGSIGICDSKDRERVHEYLTERGWIGPKGFLTKAGAAEARRVQAEWDARP